MSRTRRLLLFLPPLALAIASVWLVQTVDARQKSRAVPRPDVAQPRVEAPSPAFLEIRERALKTPSGELRQRPARPQVFIPQK